MGGSGPKPSDRLPTPKRNAPVLGLCIVHVPYANGAYLRSWMRYRREGTVARTAVRREMRSPSSREGGSRPSRVRCARHRPAARSHQRSTRCSSRSRRMPFSQRQTSRSHRSPIARCTNERSSGCATACARRLAGPRRTRVPCRPPWAVVSSTKHDLPRRSVNGASETRNCDLLGAMRGNTPTNPRIDPYAL